MVVMYNQMCQQQHGTHAEFDGTDSCQCKDGYEEGAGGQCVAVGGAGGAGGATRGSAGGEVAEMTDRDYDEMLASQRTQARPRPPRGPARPGS
jgi:hypothetical protein